MRDPYEVLGVAKSAPAKDIKTAYRKLAKRYHPDQNPDDPKAKERFAAVNQAYEIVGDDKKRAAFDRGEIDAEGKQRFQGFESAGGDPFAGFRRQGGGAGPGGMRWEFRGGGPGAAAPDGDIFSEIFGQAFSQRPGGAQQGGGRAGPDVNVNLDVSVEEAATGARVNALFPDGRRMALKLPDYLEDGQVIRLKGQGEQGPFGQPGDALVKVRIRRHPRYTIDGRDLHADLEVPLADAVLGAKLPVETPTGRLAVNVPAASSSDRVLRVKGKGLPAKGGGNGDLYVHVRVMLPEAGNAELEALARKLRG